MRYLLIGVPQRPATDTSVLRPVAKIHKIGYLGQRSKPSLPVCVWRQSWYNALIK